MLVLFKNNNNNLLNERIIDKLYMTYINSDLSPTDVTMKVSFLLYFISTFSQYFYDNLILSKNSTC